MRDVSLTLIQTFFIVARDGSYSAAARKLNMSYQSAANHVRRLEQLLGERLVLSEKGVKSLTLTPRALSLYKLLEPDLNTMLSRLGRILDKERPLLRVGLPQAIFYYLFPNVMRALREQHPELEIVAYERDTAIPDLIKSGSIDVCITERFFGDPAVPQHLVGSYRLCLVYPASWEAPPADAIQAWAAGRPFITYEPGQLLRDIALDYLKREGHAPTVAISTSGSSSVKKCVEAGLGFGIIPNWCMEPGDTAVRAVMLDELPTIPIYFGEAQFLQNNPVVTLARRTFTEIAAPRLS